jgi:hypothetical protein
VLEGAAGREEFTADGNAGWLALSGSALELPA